jgi:hypothetical protein
MKILIPAAIAALAAALPTGAGTASGKSRPARCAVSGGAEAPYRGPCLFTAERGGSFTLTPARGRTLVGDVASVSVFILRPGTAEVRGLTTDGVNSRWGEARRSRRDGACWDGSDFRICVY